MRKDKMLTFRVSRVEKSNLKKLAREESHNSVAGLIMWLTGQYRSGKLKKK